MTVNIEVSARIDRPVNEVFRFVADDHVRNHPRWDPDIELEAMGPEPIGVGTMIKRRSTRGGREVEGTMEVVTFERDRAFAAMIREGDVKSLGHITVEPGDDGGTILAIRGDFPDMDEAMADTVRELMTRSAQTIKRLVESESAGP